MSKTAFESAYERTLAGRQIAKRIAEEDAALNRKRIQADHDIIRRITERGLKRAQERKDSEFIDIFQHLKDELERIVE